MSVDVVDPDRPWRYCDLHDEFERRLSDDGEDELILAPHCPEGPEIEPCDFHHTQDGPVHLAIVTP